MRGLALLFTSIAITGLAVFFTLYKDAAFEETNREASIGALPKTISLSELGELKGSDSPAEAPIAIRAEVGPAELKKHIEAADKYLNEALPLIEAKDRFILIDKINSFKEAYALALAENHSEPMISATARYIAAWSPFYYYIHSDAQRVLGPIVKMLERERAEMLKEFAKQDARRAGRIAAEDIEYYIEDIRKSAARRNSDFITFSLQDYEMYRKTFDELAQSHKEFLFGFAEQAYILFDDFYRMHEEVDQEYSDKTRGKVEDVRLDLRDLHKRALLVLGLRDASAARAALDRTITTIESELSSHGDWRSEIHDIMKFDYEFYKAIAMNP